MPYLTMSYQHRLPWTIVVCVLVLLVAVVAIVWAIVVVHPQLLAPFLANY